MIVSRKARIRICDICSFVQSSDGNRLESSTSIIGGPRRFDNRLIIEMRTLVQWALLNQFWDKISSSLNDT